MKRNILKEKSTAFAIRIDRLYPFLKNRPNEFFLANKHLCFGFSNDTFIKAIIDVTTIGCMPKQICALKETDETNSRIDLLFHESFLENKIYQSLLNDCNELITLLTAHLKTAKQRIVA